MTCSGDVSWVPSVGPEHLDDLMLLLAQTWWTRDRDRDVVEVLLGTTSLFAGLSDENGRLIACVRVLTDWCCKAIIMDVIVDEPKRSRRLGQTMLTELLSDERLAGVAELELYCAPELVSYYEDFGFQHLPGTLFMRLSR